MSTPNELATKPLEYFESFIRDPEKRVKQLIRKLTHSGETDLDKDDLVELKRICKHSIDQFMVLVYKECMKHLRKDHSQVRVATIKLFDYLFQKSHILREKLLDDFDIFLRLTLGVTHKPRLQSKLPPPKKYAALLQELSAKLIHKWHADFGEGYEKIRYAYKFLREHKLVDFNRFQVNTREQLIKQQKALEQQERILTRSIENRLKEYNKLKPETERLLAQIQSLIDLLVPTDDNLFQSSNDNAANEERRDLEMQQHGIANLSQNISIEFEPFVEIRRGSENKEIVQNLQELKKELIDGKLRKLIAIEKTISRRSDQMVSTLREIIELKNRSTNIVMKLGELQIVNEDPSVSSRNKASTLDRADSESDDSEDFDEVEPKEGLETYIPKNMRFEYGLEPIDERELDERNQVTLNDEFLSDIDCRPSTSSDNTGLSIACNVRLESGKLCPRRDKIKCPFHGKIIPRDHLGVPLNEEDVIEEEKQNKRKKKNVPEWQDPELLAEIRAATGVDLTMPSRGPSGKIKISPNKNLANLRTCDLTPKQRLQKKLKLMIK